MAARSVRRFGSAAARRYAGWFNDFTRAALERRFADAGFAVASAGTWSSQLLYRFERR